MNKVKDSIWPEFASKPPVVDTSVLVAFSCVEEMVLLREVVGRVLVPMEVFDELITYGEEWVEAAAAQEVVREGLWVDVVILRQEGIGLLPCSGVDAGEQAVISLAAAWGRTPLIDEPKGRREARRHGLRPMGTLGLLGCAIRLGKLARAGPVIAEMKCRGLRFSDEIVSEFLAHWGERWPP